MLKRILYKRIRGKTMYRALRFLISYLVSCFAVYLSGFGALLDDVIPGMAATIFLLFSLIIAVIIFFIWEMYLKFKDKIENLTKRIEELEEKAKEKL